MLVSPSQLAEVKAKLLAAPVIAVDTETTGLHPWQGDRLFSIIAATKDEVFYFDHSPGALPKDLIKPLWEEVFADHLKVVHMMNAKFDMAMLWQEGVTNVTFPIIIDAQVTARLLQSDLLNTSMEALAPWVGMEKDKQLEAWALANGAWEWEEVITNDGEKERHKRVLYHKVPLHVTQPYAENDARITFRLGEFILQELKKLDDQRLERQPSVLDVLNSEIKTTKTLFDMEREGVLIDEAYVDEAFAYEQGRHQDAAKEFALATGMPFKNSGLTLGKAFEQFSIDDKPRFKYTPTGKFCTKAEVLDTFKSPLARVVQEYRDAYKRSGTYFANYKLLHDDAGRIHANFRQGGPRTGRLSCSEPNLQNVTKSKDKESRYPVRRCFIPPKGWYWGSLDFQQMEYRLMLDYAGEAELISQVLSGLDIHEATARMMGKSRQEAKTLNFMLLYGGGVAKLAMALFDVWCDEDQLKALWRLHNGWKLHPEHKKVLLTVPKETRDHDIPPLVDANALRELYFAKLPRVKELISAIIDQAEKRRIIFNWAGRIYRCPDPRFSYKLPNYLIQGGCSDVMKLAMPRTNAFLKEKKASSKLVLQVHDELDLYVHPDELDLLPEIKGIMESVYPYKHLPLTASVSLSEHSWADVEDWDHWQSKKNQPSQTVCESV